MKEEAAAPTASTSRAVLSDSEIVEEMVIQRSSRARTTALGKGKKVESEHESEESDEDGAEGLTRCVCAEDSQFESSQLERAALMVLRFSAEELGQALMIQCDTCKCWQHGPCVGLWGEKVSQNPFPCDSAQFGVISTIVVFSSNSHSISILTPLTRPHTGRTVPIATSASYVVQAGTGREGQSTLPFLFRNYR